MTMSKSGIHIKPSKKGTFTAAAKKHGKGVQEFARQVMANKENYSPAMVKKANFARNAAKWKHEEGGAVDSHYQELGGVHSMRPLPGHQVPVGKAFTPTPGHYYPMYERDMQPLPQKARYGADIEPFVYHGYSDNIPMGNGIKKNLKGKKSKYQSGGEMSQDQQAGTNLGPIPYHEMYMGRPVPSPNEIIAKERKNNQRIVEERKNKIKASEQARKRPLSAQQFADETQAIGDKLRLFPEDPNSFVDDFLNPGVFVGNLASGLGRIPLNLQQGNYGEAAMNVAAPLAAGALSKIGASNQLPKTTMVSNASQPYKNEILKSFMASSPKPIRTAATNEIERQYADEALKSFIGNPDKQAVFEKWNPELLKYIGVDTNMGLNPHLEGGRTARNLSKESGIFSTPADKFSKGYNLWDLLSESNYHMRKNKYGGYVPMAEPGIKLPEVEGISSQYVTPEMAAAATANYTPAQNQAANPIATAAGITTNSNMGLSANGLTHEVGHSGVSSIDNGILGMQKQNAASTGLSSKTKNSENKKKDKSWIGPTLLTGLAMANEMIKGPANRQYYTQYDEPYYNPYPSGTGSQAIYDQGGFVNSNAVDFPYKSGIRFREGGEIMNVASLSNPIARMGGNIRRNMMSEYEQGGELELYDDRTGAQPISENPNAGPIVEFKGPSHEERNNVGSNGIPMAWNGNEVEVEGGETAFKDNQGNFQILGNMKNPLTGRKFKQDGKLIAKAERKADKTMQKGLDLINSSDPDNPYEMLRFNSGKAKMQGATQKFQEMEELRNNLAAIQQQKLDLAEALGIEPMEMDKKAYFGKMMAAQAGVGLGSKFGDFTPYSVPPPTPYAPPLPTSGIFGVPQWQPQDEVPMMEPVYVTAKIPKKGSKTAPTGKPATSSTAAAAKRAPATFKTRGPVTRPDNTTPPTPQGPDVTPRGFLVPSLKPDFEWPEDTTTETTTTETTNPPVEGRKDKIEVPPRLDLTSDAEPFNITNAYPEIYSMATNRYEPVLMQKYRPELLQPYQVSFQDQLNRNTDTFRTMAKASGWNPSAMGALAAQKYAADQGVLGNQFRTNQEISANIANANRQIMNETQQANLRLADQQYMRQAQARANTNQRTFDTLQSLSTKKLQHQKAMNELKVLENLYNFRFGQDYRAKYEGPRAVFNDPLVVGIDKDGNPIYKSQLAPTAKKTDEAKKSKYGISINREFKHYK